MSEKLHCLRCNKEIKNKNLSHYCSKKCQKEYGRAKGKLVNQGHLEKDELTVDQDERWKEVLGFEEE